MKISSDLKNIYVLLVLLNLSGFKTNYVVGDDNNVFKMQLDAGEAEEKKGLPLQGAILF